MRKRTAEIVSVTLFCLWLFGIVRMWMYARMLEDMDLLVSTGRSSSAEILLILARYDGLATAWAVYIGFAPFMALPFLIRVFGDTGVTAPSEAGAEASQ